MPEGPFWREWTSMGTTPPAVTLQTPDEFEYQLCLYVEVFPGKLLLDNHENCPNGDTDPADIECLKHGTELNSHSHQDAPFQGAHVMCAIDHS